MLMELLATHDQCVADFVADDQKNDILSYDIIQDAEISHAKFVLSDGVGPKTLDRSRRRRRPSSKSSENGGFDGLSVAGRQGVQLRLCLVRDRDSKSHLKTPHRILCVTRS
jgi:hypothetical protein